jgi:hypothetical protein
MQKHELRRWKTKLRPVYLDKLYQVRDTFDMRVDLMRKRYHELIRDREIRVQGELRRRRDDGQGCCELSSIEWDWKLHFETDHSNLNKGDEISTNHTQLSESNFSSDYECESLDHFERAQREEDIVRINGTTEDEKICSTAISNLEKRLNEIDQLLESLQEEQWKDEEEGLDDGHESDVDDGVYINSSEEKLSIIDHILAMILGSMPQTYGKTLQEHYASMRSEHEEIIRQWKDYFGRLPYPSPTRSSLTDHDFSKEPIENGTEATCEVVVSSPAKQRSTLGIFDNEFIDWEDVEDWKDIV